MDLPELQIRVIAILTAEVKIGAGGVGELPEGFEATRAEVENVIQTGDDVGKWADFAEALDTMKETLSDPKVAGWDE